MEHGQVYDPYLAGKIFILLHRLKSSGTTRPLYPAFCAATLLYRIFAGRLVFGNDTQDFIHKLIQGVQKKSYSKTNCR